MKCVLAILGFALCVSPAYGDALRCDLNDYKAASGIGASLAQDALAITWPGDANQSVRLRLGIDAGAPVVREIAVREGTGPWKTVVAGAAPAFRVVAGFRRMSNQQMVPLRGLGIEISQQIIDEKKWDAFWDAPLDMSPPRRPGRPQAEGAAPPTAGAAPAGAPPGGAGPGGAGPGGAGPGGGGGMGGNPPPADGIAGQPGLPRKPEEITRADASYKTTGCKVTSEGARLSVSFDGMTMGPFAGRLQFTVYTGTNLIRMEAIAMTNEPSVAYKYDAGLAGIRLDEATRVSWRDTSNFAQDYRFGGARNDGPVPVKSANRVIVAENAAGSIAALPPPHTFFWTREVETNLGYSWYQKEGATTFGFGIRQAELEEDERYWPNFALFSARPGTWQRMASYFVVSAGKADRAHRSALAFTRDDRYKPLPGYKTMVSHFHTSMGERLLAAKNLDMKLPDIDAFRSTGVDIVSITDRPGGPQRLETMAAFYEGARRHSDKGFLVMPNEEAANILGGHWDILLSKPVFWTRDRKEGQPLVEDHPKYGKVYRTGSAEDIMAMADRENAIIYMPHPRTKGSTNYPDAIKDSFQFKHARYRGVGWRWGMGLDLSETRLSERRVLPLLDDMNNWMVSIGGPPKQIHAITETYHKEPGDDIYANNPVSYLKLDTVPGVDDMSSVIDTLSRGDYFVTSGEVLIPSFTVKGTGAARTISADVEWTFPMEFVEVVWGDGKTTDRTIVAATHLAPFGTHRFEIPFDATGKKWVRFAAWDSAGNGAMVQPVWLDAGAQGSSPP